jgi:hypothetical protein
LVVVLQVEVTEVVAVVQVVTEHHLVQAIFQAIAQQ